MPRTNDESRPVFCKLQFADKTLLVYTDTVDYAGATNEYIIWRAETDDNRRIIVMGRVLSEFGPIIFPVRKHDILPASGLKGEPGWYKKYNAVQQEDPNVCSKCGLDLLLNLCGCWNEQLR